MKKIYFLLPGILPFLGFSQNNLGSYDDYAWIALDVSIPEQVENSEQETRWVQEANTNISSQFILDNLDSLFATGSCYDPVISTYLK
jgi:hypothetical protein